MKRVFAAVFALAFALVFVGTATAAQKMAKAKYKAGDVVYVCNCGPDCPCLTMSKKEGKCVCGKEMVKTKIDKVVKGKAYVMVNGKQRVFKTTGKYVCNCGPDCPCDTISQKPGNCVCGKPMVKASTAK